MRPRLPSASIRHDTSCSRAGNHGRIVYITAACGIPVSRISLILITAFDPVSAYFLNLDPLLWSTEPRTSTSLPSMASITPSRLAALNKLRCSIFQTSYNPTSMRTGAKYLRARLVGPSMVNYYPETLTVAQLRASTNYKWNLLDEAEVERLEDIEYRKARGKGTPKKAKNKGVCLHVRILRTKLTRSVIGESRRTSKRR
ncbi:hypothetical protein BDW22DRAFT_983833 [Trametopsis cervina]|nr:hypothetical protein BDW22DRAFT_983833 [Trametopsis cervina]